MKKQYFIYSVITCMLLIFNVKAQNTPIDDFLKKYPSIEGVTSVSMSQQMLQAIFAPPKTETTSIEDAFFSRKYPTVPEAYSSVTVSKKDVPENLFTDFKRTLLSSKYEQFMEMKKENNSILGYYMKKVNDNTNEIVVLRHQKDQFSAIYIKGDIDINYVNHHLTMIKSALNRLGVTNTGIYHEHQFAFTMPSFDNFKFPNFKEFEFKFDSDDFNFKMDEDLKLRMEESMKKIRDAFEGEDFQRKIKDSMEDVQKRLEEAQRLMEDKIKQIEEEKVGSL